MKKWMIALCLWLMAVQTAAAQTVVVDGVGVDRDAALRDAARAAVEQVAGSFIDTRTLVEASAFALDEVYTHAQGFVRNIAVVEEGTADGFFRVRARVDVDTDPNTQLMQRLDMIMRLNDPRIGVVILQEEDGAWRSPHDTILETALNERLLAVGFAHVVDVGLVAQLQDSALLNAIYRGDNYLAGGGSERPLDYLVLGMSRSSGYPVKLPDGKGGYTTTPLASARTELDVKILNFGTGTLLATFSVEGQGVENSKDLAERKARRAAAAKAAEKLEEQFRRTAARAFTGIQMTVRARDLAQVEQLVQEVRALRGVQDVYMRGMADGKATIEIASAQKPYTILQMLQRETHLSIFVEAVSDSELCLALR